MGTVSIVGRDRVTSAWERALRQAGHTVEIYRDALAFQDRFSGPPPDVLVVEIVNADQGEAMLMFQARSVWNECRVMAVPQDQSYRSSAVYAMGLWHPDRVLMQPLSNDLLIGCVRQLQLQPGVERRAVINRAALSRPSGGVGNVVVRAAADPLRPGGRPSLTMSRRARIAD